MHRATGYCLILAALVAPASTPATPGTPLTPGAMQYPVQVNTPCPRFEWTPVAHADRYWLRVYRRPAGSKAPGLRVQSPLLSVTTPGNTTHWVPSGRHCLEAGKGYAWTVTADRGEEASRVRAESQPYLFRVNVAPRFLARRPTTKGTAARARLATGKSHDQKVNVPLVQFGRGPLSPDMGRLRILDTAFHRGISFRADASGGVDMYEVAILDDGSEVRTLLGSLSAAYSYFEKPTIVGDASLPETYFDVVSSVSGSAAIANHVALVENTSAADSGDVLALQVGDTGSGVDAANNFISFKDGNGNAVGAIEGNGGGITVNTTGGDFAEYLPTAGNGFEPGTVVGLSGGKLTLETGSAARSLVITSSPAILGNRPRADDRVDEHAPVAFLGQVPVKVRGPVEAGDLLVPSGKNDGFAVARSVGTASLAELRSVIGRALESSEGGEAKVEATVGMPKSGPLVSKLERQQRRIENLSARLERIEQAMAEQSR